MAGEWLKFEVNTPEKPEVFAITVAMGWDDPDLTVGKLLKIWRWFDQQSIDGNARNVTLPLLDRICGVSGFAKAMCDVGWLTQTDTGICLPNFDRHNGKTAKDRALTAKRVAKHKSNAKDNDGGNGDGVTPPLPRKEKKREEKKELKTEGAASPLPDWLPVDSWNGYLEMRKRIKKPPTDRAIELVLKALDGMRANGQDVAAVLDKSTANNWTDVYPIRDAGPARRQGDQPDKYQVAGLDHSSTKAAMEESMKRHNIVVPEGDIEF